jgi:hypothetical protein
MMPNLNYSPNPKAKTPQNPCPNPGSINSAYTPLSTIISRISSMLRLSVAATPAGIGMSGPYAMAIGIVYTIFSGTREEEW